MLLKALAVIPPSNPAPDIVTSVIEPDKSVFAIASGVLNPTVCDIHQMFLNKTNLKAPKDGSCKLPVWTMSVAEP